MTSKTFESIDQTRQLHVKPLDKHVTLVINYKDAGRSGLTISHSDAPALALAILEAAGVKPEHPEQAQVSFGSTGHLSQIVFELGRFVKAEAMHAKLAREQAELEAEALELHNAFWAGLEEKQLDSWDDERGNAKNSWVSAARRAREMRTEK